MYSSLLITRPAVKHSFFFCLGWLGQKQISAYISQHCHQIYCWIDYIERKANFLTK